MIKIVLTLLVIFAFYIIRLQDVITYDEVYTFYAYSYNPLVALLRYTLPNNHQLHSVLVWFSTSLIGDSVIAIRLPALFASMLTVSVMYAIAKRFYTSYIGWLLVILLAVHPLYIQYSVESRGYMLSNLLFLVLISRISRRNLWGKKQSYLIMILCSGLMITLPTMIIVIIASIIWGIGFHHRRTYRQFVVFPAITGCIIGGMFYVSPLLQGLFAEFSQMFGYKHIPEFMQFFVSDFILSAPSALVPFILLLVGLPIYHNHRTNKRPLNLLGIVILITAGVLSIQFFISGSIIFPRNLFFLLPVLILAVGNIFWRGIDNRGITIIAILYLFGNLWIGTLPQEDMTENLIEDISMYAQPTDYLVFACCQEGPIRYELEHRGQIHLIDDQKIYDRVVIFTFDTPIEDMIERYKFDVRLDDCYIDDWNRFYPYICEVKSIIN